MTDVAAITELYDKIGDITANLLGGNIHLGYWEDEHDTSTVEEATDRVTDLVAAKLRVGEGARIIDVGCGNGRPAERMASALGATITGVTISEHHLRQARSLAVSGKLSFQLADAMNLPFSEATFDAAVAIESLSLMPEPSTAVREIERVLKPGGRLAIVSAVIRWRPRDQAGEFFERMYDVLVRPRFETALSYATMLSDAGLYLETLEDIGDHVYRGSFAALVPDDPVRCELEYARLGLAPDEVAAVVNVLREFGKRPEPGYLVMVARKPW